jgi:3,4-dihydroxy 2-butanone 4-phosphate synthase/GTP cyclohydrolase II
MKIKSAPISLVLEAISKGHMVVVADNEQRENEGELICAAEYITPENINFMITYGRGLVCLALDPPYVSRLNLPPMVQRNTETMGTAFTVSVDAHPRFGVTTGISARDRATTIRVAVDPSTEPEDLVRPGHIFPLRARPGGLAMRQGHTEAAVELAFLAGLAPAGVIVNILRPDGSAARKPDLLAFCKRHGLLFTTIEALLEYSGTTQPLSWSVETSARASWISQEAINVHGFPNADHNQKSLHKKSRV